MMMMLMMVVVVVVVIGMLLMLLLLQLLVRRRLVQLQLRVGRLTAEALREVRLDVEQLTVDALPLQQERVAQSPRARRGQRERLRVSVVRRVAGTTRRRRCHGRCPAAGQQEVLI